MQNFAVATPTRYRMPQALESSGAQTGTGSMLVRETVTLFWVEAEEVWVEAAAPVMTRTATKARMMSFMMDPLGYLC
jgi:hypothetical protein